MADLGYLNLFTHDIQKMSSFYADLFQLEEICESRSPIFRGLRTGKANLGFNANDAYTLLSLTLMVFWLGQIDVAAKAPRQSALGPEVVVRWRDQRDVLVIDASFF